MRAWGQTATDACWASRHPRTLEYWSRLQRAIRMGQLHTPSADVRLQHMRQCCKVCLSLMGLQDMAWRHSLRRRRGLSLCAGRAEPWTYNSHTGGYTCFARALCRERRPCAAVQYLESPSARQGRAALKKGSTHARICTHAHMRTCAHAHMRARIHTDTRACTRTAATQRQSESCYEPHPGWRPPQRVRIVATGAGKLYIFDQAQRVRPHGPLPARRGRSSALPCHHAQAPQASTQA